MTMATGLLALALLQAGSPAAERSLAVTIVDERGAPVQGLTRDEVVVLEGGVARDVTRFDRDQRPLDLAILVDSSLPMASLYRLNVVGPVVQLLRRLPEGTRHVAWSTGDRPTKVMEYGDDPAQTERALKRVMPSGGNTLLDTLVEAARDLKGREGRRPVVLAVTGTGIGFSDRDRRRVVDEGIETGVEFMAVQYDDAGDTDVQAGSEPVSRQDYDYVLSELSRRSGGRRERTLSAMGVRGALDDLAADLLARYRLTYSASGGGKDDKLEVQVARPGVKVRWSRPAH